MRFLSLSKSASRAAAALTLAAFIGLGTSSAMAISAAVSPTTLTDGNASTTIDPVSQSGEDSFIVNGTQELSKQWLWYSYGGSAPTSIDTLPLESSQETGTNILNLKYVTDIFSLDVNYLLTGGTGNGAASLAETITVDNLNSEASLPFHLYEYDNFTLDNSTTGNVASISGGNTATQTGPKGTTATVTVLSPTPAEYAADSNGDILSSLNGSSPVTLTDSTGPTAPGDAEFAFEWDPTIAVSGSFQVSKLKTITPAAAVPVPAAAWTGLITLAGLASIRLARRAPVV